MSDYTDELFMDYEEDEQPRTCNFCGEKNLYFDLVKDQWILFNQKGKIHVCKRIK